MGQVQNCVQAFVNQLVASNLAAVVICPGSRNAPLIQAFLNHQNSLQIISVVDERSAAYIAMGIAQQKQEPVAVVSTSGTASANFIPASIEAYYSGIPLLILTADRPSELIDQWDGQCIRQSGLFSKHINAEFQTPQSYSNTNNFKSIAKEAIYNTVDPEFGPVHVNIPLKEPLYDRPTEKTVKLESVELEFKANKSAESDIQLLKNHLQLFKKLIILNGANYPKEKELELLVKIPVFSDIISNRKNLETIPFWDAILSTKLSDKKSIQPELLITTGRFTISKGLKTFLRNHQPIKHLHISFNNRIGNPFFSEMEHLHISEDDLISTLNKHSNLDETFFTNWRHLSESFEKNINSINQNDWNEYFIVKKVIEQVPKNSSIQLANSMSIRYASFVNQRTDIQFYGNRGTSGIEGSNSTAVGAALSNNKINTLITGDISFFYDLNALWLNHFPKNLNIIVLNNNGGDIFNIIEGPSNISEALPYQTTNHQRSIKRAAKEFGLTYLCAANFEELSDAMEEIGNNELPHLLEIKTSTINNKKFYQRFKNITL